MIPAASRRALTLATVMVLLAIMESAMLLSVRQESQTSDEAYTLFAGYLHLTTGNASICPAYPPLTKDVGALPFLVLRPRVPPMTDAEASDFRGGRIFLYANQADRVLFAARAAMTVFPLILALLVFLAAWEMFGPGPAFVALGLVVFEPNFLAHGPLVTNDVALACGLFATVYAFWRYVANPNVWRLAVAGIAAGLALAAKHSGVILFPILLLLALAELVAHWWTGRRIDSASNQPERTTGPDGDAAAGLLRIPGPSVHRLFLRLALGLIFVVVVSWVVLWAFYGFRYSAKPMTSLPASTLATSPAPGGSHLGAAVISLARRYHALPEAFLDGFVFFLATATRPTYLFGRLYPHGVWFYFPAAMAIKSTLGFLLLLALASVAGLLRTCRVARRSFWMLIPAAAYLAASMTSHLNIGLRHILPAYPFLIVLAAAGGWGLGQRHRAWGCLLGVLILIHAGSSWRAFPNYLAYSNELWGGTSKTYRVLTDSNVDWGQGLPAVKRYLSSHAGTPCWLAYFGTVDPAYYGIPCALLTTTSAGIWGRPLGETPPVIEGTVLVSATEMSGQAWGPGELNPYDQFRTARPVDCLAGSILVYPGRFQVPLASALSRLWKVVALARQGDYEGALAGARAAEVLAPRSVDVQFVLGRVLKAVGREEESSRAFENALHLARTVHPASQEYWVSIIEQEMGRR